MKLQPKALGLSLGIIAAVCLVFITYYPVVTEKISFMNMHGNSLRFIFVDLYPMYAATPWWRALIIGPILAFIDGFLLGYFTAVIYNWAAGKSKK